MSKFLNEIGIERELFLIDKKGEIVLPREYGFPTDCMEFLIETRSVASNDISYIYDSCCIEYFTYDKKAKLLGFCIDINDNYYVTEKFVDKIENKYNTSRFVGASKNIYGTREDHSTGIFRLCEDLYKLTAGIHVHFSRRDKKTGKLLMLPYEGITLEMDKVFENEIIESDRIKGEYELKPHGFEYRSLPANADILKVLKKSMEILENA